ncbi:hypothetical protein DPEC_G00104360 [Dallia pectoralis]|uniref:Uncharacterized protein n=1 Tax=Dallia pectoralis TaxID=75939 RepID=A0ACC2GXF3_DALPE|nr:hypothetical protein DPEC_G00104360 [Dallia pectoralis]
MAALASSLIRQRREVKDPQANRQVASKRKPCPKANKSLCQKQILLLISKSQLFVRSVKSHVNTQKKEIRDGQNAKTPVASLSPNPEVTCCACIDRLARTLSHGGRWS